MPHEYQKKVEMTKLVLDKVVFKKLFKIKKVNFITIEVNPQSRYKT